MAVCRLPRRAGAYEFGGLYKEKMIINKSTTVVAAMLCFPPNGTSPEAIEDREAQAWATHISTEACHICHSRAGMIQDTQTASAFSILQ